MPIRDDLDEGVRVVTTGRIPRRNKPDIPIGTVGEIHSYGREGYTVYFPSEDDLVYCFVYELRELSPLEQLAECIE